MVQDGDREARRNRTSEAWIEALGQVARHFGLTFSVQGARQLADALPDAAEPLHVERLARKFGLRTKVLSPHLEQLTSWRLPVILKMGDGAIATLVALDGRGGGVVIFTGDGGQWTTVPLEALLQDAEFGIIPRPNRVTFDERVDAYIAPHRDDWFRRFALKDLRPYGYVLLASFVANSLSLAGVLFSMQVYDRVVPAKSDSTLYVLFAGVMLAIAFDFMIRRVRGSIIDIVGKRCDLRLSDLLFGHALRVKNSARPKSTGTFIAQLRDLEQVRETLTSSTISALADLPFFFLFLVIFWFIGGVLVAIPAAALLLFILPSILLQPRLRECASEAMRDASLRNGMLVETVQGIEDIKALQAEERFQQKWNHHNAVNADAQMRIREITSTMTSWSHGVQTSVYAFIIFFGAPMVMKGDMTTGALVGCSILGSRMMAPMAQLTGVLTRFQQAKVGLKSLDAIMRMPVDHPESETRISAPALAGDYTLRSAQFQYGERGDRPALQVANLSIAAGSSTAVLGKNGAGKSTLLLALAGMIEPVSGEVLLDGLSLQHLDPTDLRRDVGILNQGGRLFHGTIRENVTLGAPHAPQAALLDALSMVGADDFIRALPKGLDHPLQEGGKGLSGGQQQSLLLARMLVRDPTILLLDEPTAAMDETTERLFIERFKAWSASRTVVIATHRMRVLDLVQRVVVIDQGQLVMDEEKAEALAILKGLKTLAPGEDAGAPKPAPQPVRGRVIA